MAEDDVKQKQPSVLAKLAAEFVGTFTLVFTACCNNNSGGQLASLSVTCALLVSVYAAGSISGAHLNPAVSFALTLASFFGHGSMRVTQAGLYVFSQLLGGMAGAVSAAAVWSSQVGGPASHVRGDNRIHTGAHFPSAISLGSPGGFNAGRVFVAEAIYTALLVFVVLNVATCWDEGLHGKNHIYGLAIGKVIITAAAAIAHISGCSLNPAVSLGVSVAAVPFGGANVGVEVLQFLLYSAAELGGAALAVLAFAGCRPERFPRWQTGTAGSRTHSKLLAEFLGTYVLVLTVSLVVAQAENSPSLGVVGIASSLTVMVYSLAAVSGANFNPAVSFALFITGNLPLVSLLTYALVQVLGGLSAVGTAAFLEAGRWKVALVAEVADPSTVAADGSWGAIAGSEIVYTFLLVYVVLNVAVRETANQFYGMAIGMVIVAGGVAVGGLSGACFNPAVSLSLDFAGLFSSAKADYGAGYVYTAFELIGAGLAAGVFRLVNTKESCEELQEDESSGSEDLVVETTKVVGTAKLLA